MTDENGGEERGYGPEDFRKYPVEVDIELPPEAWEEACERFHTGREKGYEADLMDYLRDLIDLEYNWKVRSKESDEAARAAAQPAEGDRETTTVEVELTDPLIEIIEEVKDEDVTLSEWIEQAARIRTRLMDFGGNRFETTVDVPEEAVEWAELRAEDARIRGKEDVYLLDYVLEHVDLQFELPDESEGENE